MYGTRNMITLQMFRTILDGMSFLNSSAHVNWINQILEQFGKISPPEKERVKCQTLKKTSLVDSRLTTYPMWNNCYIIRINTTVSNEICFPIWRTLKRKTDYQTGPLSIFFSHCETFWICVTRSGTVRSVRFPVTCAVRASEETQTPICYTLSHVPVRITEENPTHAVECT